MGKRVVVVAAGDTERLALPRLLAGHGARLDIRKTRHGTVTIDDATRIITAAYWEGVGRDEPPDKAIVLVDADGKPPEAVLRALRDEVPRRLKKVPIPVLFTHAQWHLEAWFFGDARGLAAYLRRDVGGVEASRPDEIQQPKAHLKNLLGENIVYTARMAAEIAAAVDPKEVRKRSPSFAALVAGVRNGRVA